MKLIIIIVSKKTASLKTDCLPLIPQHDKHRETEKSYNPGENKK